MSHARKDQNRPVDEQIGKNVRAFRLAAGMSQDRLAGLLGVTFQQVQKYEKGSNRVSGSTLFRIAQALDVPVGALFANIPATPPGEDQSDFDRLATTAERDRLRSAIIAARAILADALTATSPQSGSKPPSAHGSR